MKKLSLTLFLLNQNTFFLNANIELWNLLFDGDELVIKDDIAKNMFFAFQTESIVDTTLKEIVGKYYKVVKRRIVVSEEYHMFIDLQQIVVTKRKRRSE